MPFDRAARPGEAASLAKGGADIFELRLDLAQANGPEVAEKMAASFAGAPLISTCRCASEGGKGGEDMERLMLIAATVRHAHAIDVELSAASILPEAAMLAESNGCELIVSFHGLSGTPGIGELEEKAEQAVVAGASIIKVATRCDDEGDVDTLAKLLEGQKAKGHDIAVMGMGDTEVAKQSRVRLARQGSLFVFASAGLESAPGQPRLKWLADQLARPAD